MHEEMVSTFGRASSECVSGKGSERCETGIQLSNASKRPALRNKCDFTGHQGRKGRSETTLSPAAQYTSPPKESAVSQNDVYFHQTGEQDVN